MVHFIRVILQKYASSPLATTYLKVFSVEVVAKTSGIILLPIYLKMMTQEEFGLYGYLFAIVTTFSLVFNLGIYVSQSKLYHDYKEKSGSVIFTLNALLVVFLFLLLITTYSLGLDRLAIRFLFTHSFDYDKYRFSILLGILVNVYSLMITNFFLTSGNIKKLQAFNLSRIFIINAAVLLLLYFTRSEDNTLVRLRYSYGIEFFILMIYSYFYFHSMTLRFDWLIAKRAVNICLPIVISAILGIIINLSDRYFIEKFGTLRDLSVYNVALTLAGIIPFIFASFQNIWLPHFLKTKDQETNRKQSKKMVLNLLILFSIISIGILAGLKVLLLLEIVDQKYESIMTLLPIPLASAIVTALTQMFSNHLIYMDKLYVIIIIGVPLSVLCYFLNKALVPFYNIYGAAISTFVVNSCYLMSYIFFVNYFYKKSAKVG